VFDESPDIVVYDSDTFTRQMVIAVDGLRKPRDIVVCRQDRQLYVADYQDRQLYVADYQDRQLYVADYNYRIWRVSADEPHDYEKWLTAKSTVDTFDVYTISLTARRLMVLLEPRTLSFIRCFLHCCWGLLTCIYC